MKIRIFDGKEKWVGTLDIGSLPTDQPEALFQWTARVFHTTNTFTDRVNEMALKFSTLNTGERIVVLKWKDRERLKRSYLLKRP